MTNFLCSGLVIVIAVLGTIPAAAQTDDVTSAAGLRDQLQPCRVDGLGEPALCGTFPVYEDRNAGSGRQIDLKVVLVPAKASKPEPDPLFLFAGGPGQSITRVGGPLVRALDKVRRQRDLVLVDQRGTGDSNPLQCRTRDELQAMSLEDMLDAEMITADTVSECLDRLDADPRLYTTPPAVDDIDDVRRALGYDRINLWGASYGTRFALVYMRRHPEAVRSVILDSVAPTTMPLPLHMARDAERAMELLIEACADDDACGEAYPTLASDLATVLTRLGAEPATVTIANPRSGATTELTITRRMFAGGLRGLLYSADLSSLIPLFIRDGLASRFDGFVAAITAFTDSVGDAISEGLMLSVLCAEDLPRVDDGEARALYQDTFLEDVAFATFRDACEVWPHGDAEPGFAEPVRSELPVLLLSGELDPVTPPEWADAAQAHLPNGRHIVVPGTGHGVTSVGCVPKLIDEFIDTADAEGLDDSCVDRRRRAPFFLDFAGTTP